MNKQIKNAFEAVQADDALKNSIRQSLAQRNHRAQKMPRARGLQLVLVAAFCLLCAVGLGGYQSFMATTAVISIDINPSIEISVNRYNRVVDFKAYNEDGQALLDGQSLKYKTYKEAVDTLLASDKIETSIASGGELVLSVAPENATQGDAITTYLNGCTKNIENASCETVSYESIEKAHALGMSCGRYKVYEKIVAYEPDFTAETCNNMTVRELHQKLGEHEGSSCSENDTTCQNNQANGHGHAYGRSHE